MTRQRAWALIGLGCAIVALLLLASSISGLTFRSGHFYDLTARMPLMGGAGAARPLDPASLAFWQMLVSIVSLALLIYLVISLILSPEVRREVLMRVISMLIVILLFYLLISALHGNPSPTDLAPNEIGGQPPPLAGEPFPTFVANPAPWLVIVISVILAASVCGGIWFVWRRRRPQKPPLMQIADEALAALAELQAGGVLADTVLRCYREMSHILSAQRGIARQRDVTPREFECQLAAVGLHDEYIQRLTRLFERVRYGPRRSSPREEREAADCLRAIVRAYGAAP